MMLSGEVIEMEEAISNGGRPGTVYFLFLGIDASLQAMLQGKGSTKPIMYAGIIKVGLNVFVSWVLIFWVLLLMYANQCLCRSNGYASFYYVAEAATKHLFKGWKYYRGNSTISDLYSSYHVS